jgi:hypothetical protein
MLIRVPYMFEGDVSYSRNRKNELAELHSRNIHFATMEVDVPYLTEEEAPIMATANVQVAVMSWREVAVRHYDGRFFCTDRLSPKGDGGRVDEAHLVPGTHWPGKSQEHPIFRAYAGTPGLFGWGTNGVQVIEDMLAGREFAVPKGTVHWDRRGECEAVARSALSRLIVVDGEVWHEVCEPKIVVKRLPWHYERNRVVVELSVEPCMGERAFAANSRAGLSVFPENTRVFPLSDLEGALEFAGGFDVVDGVRQHVSDIAVLMTEVLEVDTGLYHLAKVASDFLVQTHDLLYASSESDIARWVALRRQLDAAQKGEGDAAGLAEAITGMTKGGWSKVVIENALRGLEVYDTVPVEFRPQRVARRVPK